MEKDKKKVFILLFTRREMKLDCGFTREKYWFRYRAGAIIIHNGKMLFVKSKIGGYCYMIGGGVRLGETSVECIERELLEETGIQASVKYLSVICENFFKGHGGIIDGMDCHTVEFYYQINLTDEQRKLCRTKTDDGEQLVWIGISDVKNSFIKPAFIAERILEILDSNCVIHIIEKRDA